MSSPWLLRVDAWPEMGTGHVMRCLALAAAWQSAGQRACFVSHCTIDSLRTRMIETGARLVALPQPVVDPNEAQSLLAPLLAQGSPSHRPGWLLLDGYHFSAQWQSLAQRLGLRLLVIDDQALWPRYEADLVLNQNHGAQRLEYDCGESTHLLLGARYVLLRPEFAPWMNWQRDVQPEARRLLVTLGGSDPAGATPKVLEALREIRLDGLEVRLIVGPGNPAAQSISDAHNCLRDNVQVLTNVADMAQHMAWADVAVSAAGTTCWELAFMQLPALLLIVADNQRPTARQTALAGTAENLGPVEQVFPEQIAAALLGLIHDRTRRCGMALAGRRLVDGRGAQRVVTLMRAWDDLLPEQTTIRPAVREDSRPLWRLVNQPSVRRSSLRSGTIPLEEHEAWFTARLNGLDARIWVLELEGLLLGQVRYERTEPQTAEISYSVTTAFRRRGLGTRLIAQTWRQAAADLGVRWLRAVVRVENEASTRTFRKLGFDYGGRETVCGHLCHLFQREVLP